jgi:hypothetical protein
LTRANVSSLEDGDAKPKHLATKCDFPGISYAAWLYANRLTKRTGRKERRFARLSGLNFMCRASAATLCRPKLSPPQPMQPPPVRLARRAHEP